MRSHARPPRDSSKVRRNRVHRILSTDLRNELHVLGKRPGEKRAAVAYVTSDDEVHFGEGDTLVVDACDAMIAGGQTSAKVLARAFKRGARIYSLPSLHTKLFLFGRTAVIGSANLSGSNLIEAGLVTSDHAIASGVASLIDEIVRRAQRVDESFLKRIARISVKRRFVRGSTRTGRRRIKERGNRTWIVNVRELPDSAFPHEQARADRGMHAAKNQLSKRSSDVSWIRFSGNARLRHEAGAGDSVIQIWTGLGNKRPRVLMHSPILRVQKEKACTRFYVESYQDEKSRSLSWTEFTRLTAKIGSAAISRQATRLVPDGIAARMYEEWGKGRRRS